MLKDTLLMPNSAFPMRAGLPMKEPLLIKRWGDIKLYEKMNADREGCEEFMLHDGPPYANGDIHCGHALNRCLKDFVVRYKNMKGFKTPFVFGFDTHGLPIEVMVTKSGVDRKKMGVVEFRKKCDEYAHTQVDRQMSEIKRLGCLGDYEHPYLTLLPEFEARQIEVFAKMALDGLIFKGVKPVYWSPSSESALAEAEIEYHDVPCKTLYIAFEVKDGKGKLPEGSKVIIWTTTPWTIPANLAITLNPRFEYGLYHTDKGDFLFLCELKDKLVEELGFSTCELLKTFKGQELEGVVTSHPLYGRESPLILASFVTSDSGTGCVHTAPDHGLDDFNACAKYGIKPFCPVDEKGYMHLGAGDPLDGMFYEEANDKVIELLATKGAILKEEDIVHSYPHDWRTKKPVIFRATPQWFCSISPIRQKLLDEVDSIEWVPGWGKGKMVNMIKDRADWCISRQRAWGVAIPIIYNEDGSPIIDKSVFEHIASLIREHGSSYWFEASPKQLLPVGYTNPASPNGAFTKETDIMDVWFDSGSSWNGVLRQRALKFPADLYLEGNDQYRGWFNASLTLSTAFCGKAPFKTCLTHGWVMDENWQKMSKSKGNGVDPTKVASNYGADILRLWAASVDYKADARIGERIIGSVADNYRKIRNTFKFMLGNLSSYHPEAKKEYSLLDKMILARLDEVIAKATESYDEYDFAGVVNAIIPFASFDLSSLYLDALKDVLYCDDADSPRRQGALEVIFRCAKSLCLLLNPILPFTMEEVYSYLPLEHKESVQLEDMVQAKQPDGEMLSLYREFLSLREVALKSLEQKRAAGEFGSSSDAKLSLSCHEGKLFDALSSLSKDELCLLFNVSDVSLEKGDDAAACCADSRPECDRCRRHYDELVETEDGHLCHRCLEALDK